MAEWTGWARWGGCSPLPSCAPRPGALGQLRAAARPTRARPRLLRHPAFLEARGAGVGPLAFPFRCREEQTRRSATSRSRQEGSPAHDRPQAPPQRPRLRAPPRPTRRGARKSRDCGDPTPRDELT